VGWLKLLLTLFGELFKSINERRLINLGKKEAELDGRKEADEVANSIDVKRADVELRKSTRKKYTRP
jgi:hypothetical protein